jgi:hypothetical protein
MITIATLARVLRGDDTLLPLFTPAQRTALLRTRERLRGVGTEVVRRIAAERPETTADYERLICIVIEEAMLELDLPGVPN